MTYLKIDESIFNQAINYCRFKPPVAIAVKDVLVHRKNCSKAGKKNDISRQTVYAAVKRLEKVIIEKDIQPIMESIPIKTRRVTVEVPENLAVIIEALANELTLK